MSDATIPGAQAPTPVAPVEEQNLEAAKPVEAADLEPTETTPLVEAPDAASEPEPTEAAPETSDAPDSDESPSGPDDSNV